MNWIIIVLCFAVVGFILGRYVLGFCDTETGVGGAILGAVIGAFIAFCVTAICNIIPIDIQYKIAEEKTYMLNTFDDGRYYTCSTILNNSYVECLVLNDDGTFEKKSYVSDIVKINPNAKEASIVIKNGKASSAKLFGAHIPADTLKSSWWIDITDEEEILEIVINIPQDLDYPDTEQKIESNTKPNTNENKAFCTSCGNETQSEWLYCGHCGKKLKE